MKAVALILAGLLSGTAAMAAVTVDNPPPAASNPGPIIWNDGAPPPAPTGSPDKNGIIWDAPGSPATKAPAPGAAMPSPPASSSSARPTKQESIIWDSPRTASANPPRPLAPAPGTAVQANGECREFQTTIVIDGQRQPAHGTACRQPDGSWRVTR